MNRQFTGARCKISPLGLLIIVWLIPMLIDSTGSQSSVFASQSQSHATHFVSPKGPQLPQNEIGCSICHAEGIEQCVDQPVFADDQPLGTTQVCDVCHSPDGVFPGVNGLDDPVIGAKENWTAGIYEADGTTLQSAKEACCATCHDDVPAPSLYEVFSLFPVVWDNPEGPNRES